MVASVGDTLKFEWKHMHNVYLLNKDFDPEHGTEVCPTSDGDGGNCTFKLETLPAYFGCTYKDMYKDGQRLTVTADPKGTSAHPKMRNRPKKNQNGHPLPYTKYHTWKRFH